MADFESLGFRKTFPISAHHSRGIGELLSGIVEKMAIGAQIEKEERICKVVLLGKPNVGKSSLMNLLLEQERSIVHDAPGTTREAITERVNFYKAEIQITDTAGIRRKRTIDEELETLMVKSSFKAVQDADIVLLLVDSSQGTLSDQEIKLMVRFYQWYKPCGNVIRRNFQMMSCPSIAKMPCYTNHCIIRLSYYVFLKLNRCAMRQ